MTSGASQALSKGASALAPSVGNTVSELVVPGVSSAVSKGASAGLGGLLSAGASAGLGSALSGSSSKGSSQTPSAQSGTQNADGSTNVDELVATAAPTAKSAPSLLNLSPALLAATGSDFTPSSTRIAGLNSAMANFSASGNDNAPTDVSEVVATAPALQSPNIETAAPGPGQVAGLESVPDLSALMEMDANHFGDGAPQDEEHKKLLESLGLNPKDLLGLGLLGLGFMQSKNKPGVETNPNYQALQSQADNNAGLINRLAQSAEAGRDGQVGGGAMNMIRRSVRNAQAAIRQRYSSMNMSGGTAETADLNAAVQAGLDAQFKLGQDIATSGLQSVAALSGVNANIYTNLLKAQTAQDTDLGNALANFVGAAGNYLHTPNIAPAAKAA